MAAKKTTGPFDEQLRLALSNYQDTTWLAENSPLAAPYFLGAALETAPDSQTINGRGRILQQLLRDAAARLWRQPLPRTREQLVDLANEERQTHGSRGSRYYYLLLDLRYFRTYFTLPLHPRADNEQAIRDYLGVGRGTFFNHLKAARQALAEALLNEVRPTFRLEQPVSPKQSLIGRDKMMASCLGDLENRHTVALGGVGGVGKTSLAVAITQKWQHGAVFWFTVSPTFNDQLSSLLFSLGYFLHRQGASNLWLQLVADGGKIDNRNLALEHFRGDIHALTQLPLICIDEVDYLQSVLDKVEPSAAQMQAFLHQLHGLVPLLLMGQRPLLKADLYHELTGFSDSETAVFLQEMKVDFTPDELTLLQNYTGGNPRLLQLCVTLYEPGKPLAAIVKDMPQTLALQSLFDRIWQRLSSQARHLLLSLAVFRSPAPDDAWLNASDSLQQLVEQQIVRQDAQGGVALLPVIRDLIYDDRQRLPAESREQAHLAAALIRATRGEYTAAAHHYSQAGEPEKAVQVWFPHRQQETRRGQAATALTTFEQLSMRRLNETEQEALALLRAELHGLAGDAQKGQAELNDRIWPTDSEIATQARLLQGDFLNALGYPQAALDQSEEGIETTARLLNQMVKFRNQRVTIHVQQRRLKQAWQETRIAQFEAERLQGFLQSEQGQYEEAYLSYQRALSLAKSIEEDAGVAQINRDLAIMLGRQGKLGLAQQHVQEAISYYQRIGDRLSVEKMRNTLSGIYFQGGQFAEAIEVAELALPFFQGAELPYWTAVTAATLAEAYYEIGDLDKATTNAQMVLQLEETQSHPYALYTLGLVQRSRQQFAQALQYFREATVVAQTNKDRFMAAYAWRMQGQTLLDQGKPQEAEKTITIALQEFESLDIAPEVEVTKKLLASISES